MNGEFFKGNINEICEKLRAEAQKRKGMTAEQWLRMRNFERVFNQQLQEIIDNTRQP